MFPRCTSVLRTDMETIHKAISLSQAVQKLLFTTIEVECSRCSDYLMGLAPSRVDLRKYEYSAAITRLYAVYEHFIWKLITEWLDVLPLHFRSYDELPEEVRRQHRAGIAYVLPRLEHDRYKELSFQRVLQGALGGGSTPRPYELLPEEFMLPDQNLRHDVITTLFTGVGIPNVWGWVKGHRKIKWFLTVFC